MRWPGSPTNSAGSVVSQMSPGSFRAQRVWKTQPEGGSARDGGSPVSWMRVVGGTSGSPGRAGIADSSASVYGWCGALKTADAGPDSSTRPAYSTTIWSDRYRTSSRSCEMNT